MNELEKYNNQDIFNPEYLYHGSPYIMEKIEPREAKDSVNKENEDTAVFLTSYQPTALAYAFRNKIKETNDNYSFSINNNGNLPSMEFEADHIPEDLFGYIYVFKKDDTMIKDKHNNSTQYKCYHSLIPVVVVKVYYKDFENYFKIYKPTILKFDARTKTDYNSLNFGQCKGMTFDRVAIFPNKKYKEFLQNGTSLDSPCKYYVSATRAKYSIVFVVEKLFENDRFKYMNIKLEDSSIKVSKYMV